MRERTTIALWITAREYCRMFEENQQSAIQTKIEQHFGGFFNK
jgi:hypothetical protein